MLRVQRWLCATSYVCVQHITCAALFVCNIIRVHHHSYATSYRSNACNDMSLGVHHDTSHVAQSITCATSYLRNITPRRLHDLPVDIVRLRISAGENRAADFLRLNPTGKLPFMTTMTAATAEEGLRCSEQHHTCATSYIVQCHTLCNVIPCATSYHVQRHTMCNVVPVTKSYTCNFHS